MNTKEMEAMLSKHEEADHGQQDEQDDTHVWAWPTASAGCLFLIHNASILVKGLLLARR